MSEVYERFNKTNYVTLLAGMKDKDLEDERNKLSKVLATVCQEYRDREATIGLITAYIQLADNERAYREMRRMEDN